MGKATRFVIHEDGTIRFHSRVCVSTVAELKKKILDEGDNTLHSMHLGRNKLIRGPGGEVLVEQHEAGGGGLCCEVLNLPKVEN